MESSTALSLSLYEHRKEKDETQALVRRNGRSTDTGWAWMVLFGSVLCHTVILGQTASIGIFYVHIKRELNISVFEITLIGSLRSGCVLFFAAVTSPLSSYTGCRRMAFIGGVFTFFSFLTSFLSNSIYAYYIFLGIIPGLGSAMSYASSMLVVNDYFDRKRPFALATVVAAGGLGVLVFSPVYAALLDGFGLEGALLINGALAFHIVVGAMLFFPQKDKITVKESAFERFKVYKDTVIWKNPAFYMVLSSTFFYAFTLFIPLTLLPDLMVSENISLDIASWSVAAQGASMMVARVLSGVVANMFPRLNRILTVTSGVVGSVFLFLIPTFHSTAEFMVASVGFGFFHGYVSGLTPVLLVEFLGSDRLPACFGVNSMSYGIGGLLGAPIASAIGGAVAVSGIEFVVSGITLLSSGLVLIPSLCKDYTEEKAQLTKNISNIEPLLKYERLS